jgi:serine O-acetyltransferase
MKLMEDLDVYGFRKGWPRWACLAVPLFYPSCWPIIVYRFGSWVVNLRWAWLRLRLYLLYFPLKRFTEVLTTVDLSEYAEIGGGFFIPHVGNIVIAHHTRIGRHASMHQGVTIGVSGSGDQLPVIGDRVYFGAGAKIIGPITIGNDVVIGANAVVTRDVPDNAVVGGIPARVLNYRGSTQFVHFRGKQDGSI